MEVKNILNKMSIEKKVAQLMQVSYTSVSKEEAEEWARRGVGSFLHVLGEDALHLQEIATSNGSGIPMIFGIDAVRGHALNKNATIFPTQLSMACSWNVDLIQEVGRATAMEVAADGLHWVFSPILCLGRDLRWGRIGETFGEDKYLTGQLGEAIIKGYQSEEEHSPVLACAKHYIGYAEATGGRDSCDTEITYRKLYDTFLPPFKNVIDAGCKTIMTAYGSIDGLPCTIDSRLLKDILRDDFGFEGVVITDWQNLYHLINEQRVCRNMEEASELSLKAGNDMMMNCTDFYDTMLRLVAQGKIQESEIDKAVLRILKVKDFLGLLDGTREEIDKSVIGNESHLLLNKKIAEESVVLLKNDNILPLEKTKKILVVGDCANDIRLQYGDWTYFSHPSPKYDTEAIRPYVTLLEGLKEEFEQVEYEKGFDIGTNELCNVERVIEKAQNVDVIIFAFGDSIFLSSEARDRANPALTEVQQCLFEKLTNLNKPIVSVMIATKPLCVPNVVKTSKAFLTAFNSGMFGGEAMAKVISGKINPCGRLPISFAHHIGQLPVYYNQLPGWHSCSYVDLPAEPLFAFGEGLSYTAFEYDNIHFNLDNYQLSFELKNVGNRKGKEIVQVYFKDVISSLLTPVKQLIAFKKIELDVGETKKITIELERESFSFVNQDCKRVVESGEFELMVGSSSKDEDLKKIKFSL